MKIKTLRAGKRQVWPGKGMKQKAWSGVELASVFVCWKAGGRKTGGRNGIWKGAA